MKFITDVCIYFLVGSVIRGRNLIKTPLKTCIS